MKKILLQNLDLREIKLLSVTDTARIFELSNGSILKIYHDGVVALQKMPAIGIDLERKILSAKPIENSPEILTPQAAVYFSGNRFGGYIMPRAQGIDFNSYDDNLTLKDRQDLMQYAQTHYKLESVLRRNPNIVFPDFCTCDNIFIDDNGNIQFIDYDGIQIGGHKTLSLSTSAGKIDKIIGNPKYFTKDGFFTKELDKKSSIHLFYLTAFNVDLNKIGLYNPFEGRNITLEDIFGYLNLSDPDMCHKTWKVLNDKEENEFLGEELLIFAEKHDLNIVAQNGNVYIKKLTRKK